MASTHTIVLHGPGEPLELSYPAETPLPELLDVIAQQMREGGVVSHPVAKGEARVHMSHVWAVSARPAKSASAKK
ncbi:hypothetical protein CLV35_0443 [Motilibacter peucedani]|uniref:Uncharacterized protein n=1 Tax=Motilibacter peucedani TaxID=598650 RepID=A0A420XT65_9ACTN|nr:hypothetical protein [Motilibacter peucedani]RKS80025.1 hypothetical protein CLV35_0443 [Motilibacter peucedani]